MDRLTEGWPRAHTDALRQALEPNETLCWAGLPDSGRHGRKYRLRILGGLPFAGFGLFLTAVSVAMINKMEGGGWFWFPLVGLPFLAAGSVMMASPFWAAFQARRLVYAVTDKRALIVQVKGGGRALAYGPEALAAVKVRDLGDGLADVVIHERLSGRQDGRKRMSDEGFYCIRDAEKVARLMAGIQP